MEMLTDLDERLFLKYIEHKSEALLEAIEEGMHAGLFDWDQCSVEPTGVRAYIQDIILSLVSIHCEVRQKVHCHRCWGIALHGVAWGRYKAPCLFNLRRWLN